MKYFLLFTFCTILFFTGCKKNVEFDEFDAVLQSEETTEPIVNKTNTEYNGEQINLPEHVLDGSETILSITVGENSPLELYSMNLESSESPYSKYVLVGNGEWETKSFDIQPRIDEYLESIDESDLTLNSIKRGMDGNLYALASLGQTSSVDSFRLSGNMVFAMGLEGEEFYELPLDVPEEEDSERQWIVNYDAFANGEIFIQYNNSAIVVDPSNGEVLKQYDTEFMSSGINIGENEIFNIEVIGNKFNVYEAVSGDVTASIDHVTFDRNDYPNWKATSNEKGFFLADMSGIYKAESSEASEFIQIVSSANYNEFSSLNMISFFVDEMEDCYVVFYDMTNREGFEEEDSSFIGYKVMKYSPYSEP